MKVKKQSFLFVASAVSNLMATALLARALKAQGHTIAFLADGGESLITRIREQVPDVGIHQIQENPTQNLTRRIKQKILSKIPGRKVKAQTLYDTHLTYQKTMLDQARKIVANIKPDLLIVPEDGIAGNTWVMRAAADAGIKILTYPYGYGSMRDLEDALARKQEAGTLLMATGEAADQIRLKAPQWIKSGKFEGAIIFPSEMILAREALNLSLANPWIVNGGFSDVIAVESEMMQAHYDSEGVPHDKCVMTGSMYADLISNVLRSDSAYRTAYEQASRITPDRVRIVISWPTDYHATRGHLCEFADYATLTKQALGALKSLENADITVSLHPATGKDAIGLITEAGFKPSTEYIIDLIPKNDVFISCYSSTTRWAIAAGKPVINYDFYGFNLPEYDSCAGVVKVSNHADYQKALHRLTQEPGYLEKLLAAQKVDAPRWGMLDGKNFERIHALIQQLAAS